MTNNPLDPASGSRARAGTDAVGPLDVVTGAFSYSGHAIAERLLASGHKVRTLTNHAERGAGRTDIESRPLDFARPDELAASLEGAGTLFNTYWVRFSRGQVDHPLAVRNSIALFEAARRAGVEKIVHTSILHPSIDSPYPYFRGKAEVEQALAASGVPYAVMRPSVLFDERGVLLNNIAWLLRRLPVFAVGGDGTYRVRPAHVGDLADLAVSLAADPGNTVVDAVGPDRPTFVDLVLQIRRAVRSRAAVVRVPPGALIGASRVLGTLLRDQLLTREEYESMAEGLADSDAPTNCPTSLAAWLDLHGRDLGRRYANEVRLHFRSG